MYIAKFVKGPMDGREMELQKLELTIRVDMQVYPESPSAGAEIIVEKGIYIREANQHRSKSPGSKAPYTYVWDGVHERLEDGWEETLKYNEAILENARRLHG